MKLSTAASASAILLAASASAFGPSPSLTHGRRTSSPTVLPLFPESSSLLLSSGFEEGLGSLALLGSVGFGIAYGNADGKKWEYEYTPGNEYGGVGKPKYRGGATAAVADKASGEHLATCLDVVKSTTTSQQEFFGLDASSAPIAAPPAPAPAAKKTKPAPSKAVLDQTEAAKAVVAAVGIEETKAKLESKASTPSPPAPANGSTEVAEKKKPGAKRRFAKGAALILAAAGMAACRNVVKAYLGRGMM